MRGVAVEVLKGLALAPAFFMFAAAPADTVPVPLGLLPIVWPRDNPYTPEKAALSGEGWQTVRPPEEFPQ